jgi:hypothetical protein
MYQGNRMVGITLQDTLASANREVEEGDFNQPRELLLDACFALRLQRPSSLVYAVGAAPQRLGARREQWEAMSQIPPQCDRGLEDWRGQPLAAKNILVEKHVGDIGADICMARLTELAARRGRRCLALVDARLVAPVCWWPRIPLFGNAKTLGSSTFLPAKDSNP